MRCVQLLSNTSDAAVHPMSVLIFRPARMGDSNSVVRVRQRKTKNREWVKAGKSSANMSTCWVRERNKHANEELWTTRTKNTKQVK